MNLIRCFIALDYPTAVKNQILAFMQKLKERFQSGDIRWVTETNLHLTLKFIGEVPEAKIDSISSTLLRLTPAHQSFTLSPERTGVFPNSKEPRILWIGSAPCPPLMSLAAAIDQSLNQHGIPAETKRFSPHLTIGRVNHNLHLQALTRIGEAYLSLPADPFDTFQVEGIRLVRSQLQAGGPIYSTIANFPLAKPFLK